MINFKVVCPIRHRHIQRDITVDKFQLANNIRKYVTVMDARNKNYMSTILWQVNYISFMIHDTLNTERQCWKNRVCFTYFGCASLLLQTHLKYVYFSFITSNVKHFYLIELD